MIQENKKTAIGNVTSSASVFGTLLSNAHNNNENVKQKKHKHT